MIATPRSSASFAGLDDGHGNAGVEEIHRDAAAHGAGADDADPLDRLRRRVRAGCRRSWPPARSAKNTWRCAFDWVEPSSVMNISRSCLMPSSNGRSTAFLTDWIAFSQASKPRNLRALALRIASKISGLPRASRELVVAVAHLLQRRLLGDQAPARRRPRRRAACPPRRARRPRPSPSPRARRTAFPRG